MKARNILKQEGIIKYFPGTIFVKNLWTMKARQETMIWLTSKEVDLKEWSSSINIFSSDIDIFSCIIEQLKKDSISVDRVIFSYTT